MISDMTAAKEFLDKFIKFYSSSALAQDLVETGTGAAIGATGQLLFTDMSPQEIALSTALGAGAAMGVRPIAANAGRFVGRKLPSQWNDKLVKLQKDMGVNLPIPTKEYLNALDNEIIELKRMGLNKEAGLMEGIKPALEAKYNAEFKDRTALEGLLGYGSRLYGDNLAQLGVAAAMPYILNSQELTNDQQIAQQ